MTLEDFLVKAAAASGGLLEERVSGDDKSEVGVVGVNGRGRWGGKRSFSLIEPLDKTAQQSQRRMIKNRESEARSRERKQAYQVELESMVVRLEEENEQLLNQKLMENVIPVVEEKRHPLLRRVRSMVW